MTKIFFKNPSIPCWGRSQFCFFQMLKELQKIFHWKNTFFLFVFYLFIFWNPLLWLLSISVYLHCFPMVWRICKIFLEKSSFACPWKKYFLIDLSELKKNLKNSFQMLKRLKKIYIFFNDYFGSFEKKYGTRSKFDLDLPLLSCHGL